jgi:Phage tail tube protein
VPASNVARLGIALQSAKGAAAAAPQYWLNFTGGNMRPSPETETRSETGLGRDVGDTYIRVLSASGDPSVLLRPKTAPLLYYCALGAKAVTGAADPYTHAITPGNDQPWITVWKEQGDSLYERFTDCKITAANLEFAAGGDLALSMTIMGLGFERLSGAAGATAGAAGVHDQGVPFRVPGAVYTLGGSVDNSLASGNYNIEAAQNPIQTVAITYSYLEPGQRTITFGYEGVYTDVTRYAKVYYGSGTGTAPSETVWEEALSFQFGPFATTTAGTKAAKFELARALFTEAAPSLDAGGGPMMLSVGGAAGRPASGAIATVSFKNDVATYPTAA